MSYTDNKAAKDRELYRKITKTITLDKKNSGLEFDDIANELGTNGGTLKNKLKPSLNTHDIGLTEFIHLIEMTGDYSALEHIANHFDMVLICKKQAEAKTSDLNLLVDKANMENADVFSTVKRAIEDGVITEDERGAILKEIDEAQKANAELKDTVLHIAIKEN